MLIGEVADTVIRNLPIATNTVVDWDALAAVAAMLATFAAAYALWQTERTRKVATRQTHYKSTYVDPVQAELTQFVNTAVPDLEQSAREIRELCDVDAKKSELDHAVAGACDRFNATFLDLQIFVTLAADAVRDIANVDEKVQEPLMAMQDEVTNKLSDSIRSATSDGEFRRIVATHVAKLMRLSITCDPGIM